MGNLLDKILSRSKWKGKDAYPSSPEWNREDNQLLEFAKQEGQLKYYQSRLEQDSKTQRDETMNELRAAYFLSKGLDFPIKEWGPNGGRGEFLLLVKDRDIFCEVKSPGWEGEIVKDQGYKSARLKDPKYINAEVRGVDNSPHIRDTIIKAYSKFPADRPTLLVIVDDFWMNCFVDGLCIDRALYRPKVRPPYVDNKAEGLFVGNAYENLGGVLFINFEFIAASGFLWKIYLASNGNAALNARLPVGMTDAVNNIRVFAGNKVQHYQIVNGWLEKGV